MTRYHCLGGEPGCECTSGRCSCAHDTSHHQRRDVTYRWACDWGVDLTMDITAQVIYECETSVAIKQAKQLKPLWYGGWWLKYEYGEAWQIGYITLPLTYQDKNHVLTMAEMYPVPHATAWYTMLCLERRALWWHGYPRKNWVRQYDSFLKQHHRHVGQKAWHWVGVWHPLSRTGKIKKYNRLLKTTLRAMTGGTLKHWDTHLAKATWLVNLRASANQAGSA